MTIRKCTLTFTFLFDDTIDSVEDVHNSSLAELVEECDAGSMLGRASDWNFQPVADEDVADEEIALGGDGTFFADPDEVIHARLDADTDD